MPVPLEDHCRQTLLENEIGAKIFASIHKAWQKFEKEHPDRGTWVSSRTSRSMFWEFAIKELLSLSTSEANLTYVEHQNTVSFILEDEVLFRIKHAKPDLKTANVTTGESVDYHDHEVDLFGRSGLQRVFLCYVLNPYETQVAWIGVAAYNKSKNLLWRIELDNAGAVAPIPSLLEDEDIDTARQVKIKGLSTEDEETGKDERGNQ